MRSGSLIDLHAGHAGRSARVRRALTIFYGAMFGGCLAQRTCSTNVSGFFCMLFALVFGALGVTVED